MSIEKAARLIDVRPATVRQWIERGDLTRYRAGRLLRVKLTELHEFLARESKHPTVAAIDVDAYAGEFLIQNGRERRRRAL